MSPRNMTFSKLQFKTIHHFKPLKIDLTHQKFFQLPSPKTKVSSVNYNMSKATSSLTQNPMNSPNSTSLLTNLVRPSMTNTNRNGDKGSPCLKPISTKKILISTTISNGWHKTTKDTNLHPLVPLYTKAHSCEEEPKIVSIHTIMSLFIIHLHYKETHSLSFG